MTDDPEWQQLLQGIDNAVDAASLRCLRESVHDRMICRLPQQETEQLYAELNWAHDRIIRRCIELAQQELARIGELTPSVPFAYLLFGSGGRREQTLLSDQDSGIVYADPPEGIDALECSRYFLQLGKAATELLQQAGYPLCEGNVLGSNPDWCRSMTEWKRQLDQWFGDPVWESVRYLLIIADGRSVYGDTELFHQIAAYFYNWASSNSYMVRRMLDNTLKHKVLLNIFGQLLKEPYGEDAGSLDLKYGAYIPMVNAVRLLAIKAGLYDTSTLARIRGLEEAGIFNGQEAREYGQMFSCLLQLRMLTMEKLDNGKFSTNGKLSRSQLTKEVAEKLKRALRLGQKLQRQAYRHAMGRARWK